MKGKMNMLNYKHFIRKRILAIYFETNTLILTQMNDQSYSLLALLK